MAVSTLQQPAAPPAQPQGFKWGKPKPVPTPDDQPPVGENPIPPVVPEPPIVPPVDQNPIPPVVPQTPQVPQGGNPGIPANPGLDQTINDQILRILNQGPVSAEDPMIKDVVNAHRTAGGRAFDRNRAMMAERRASSGFSGTGGAETGVMGLAQDRGENEAAFGANVMREAQTERANQIMAALSLGQGRISDQQRNALQQELAQLQAAIQREGMSMQSQQFGMNNELDWMRLLMGGLN